MKNLKEHIAELERERDEAEQRGYRQGLEVAGAYMRLDAAKCSRLRAAAQAVVDYAGPLKRSQIRDGHLSDLLDALAAAVLEEATTK